MSGTRRSARIKAIVPSALPRTSNTTSTRETEDTSYTASGDREPSCQKQSSRKRKVAPARTRDVPPARKKRRGKLQKMSDIPLDILFEIFGHLLPYDLLCLSRANKSLRKILMRRSSAFVWKLARANVPSLPEIPPCLSEPAYANLAFDPHCHFCGAPRAVRVAWSLMKRACNGCHKIRYSHCYSQSALELLCDRLGISSDRTLRYADIDRLPCAKNRTFILEELTPFLLEYEAVEDEGQRAEWKKLRKAEKSKRSTFAKAADRWSIVWKEQCLKEIEDREKRRGNDILDRLKSEGWGDVIDKLSWYDKMSFKNHNLVKQNKDLTERIWKNIKPQMTALLTTFHNHQHEQDSYNVQTGRLNVFEHAFDNYCASLPPDDIMFPIGNILAMDSVKAIIFNEQLDLMIDQSAFRAMFSEIPALVASWKTEFDEYLQHLLVSSTEESALMDISPITSAFEHATSLFCCGQCHKCHLTYKQVISHKCIGRSHSPFMSAYEAFTYPGIKHFLDKADFTPCLHRDQMKVLLKACGLSGNATMDTLQSMNPLVECHIPACKAGSGRHAMYWHGWLSHCTQAKSAQILNHNDLTEKMFQPLPMNHSQDLANAERPLYGCKHCYSLRRMSFMALKYHLSAAHGIEIESRASMEHYVIHPAVPPTELSYSVLYEKLLLLNI